VRWRDPERGLGSACRSRSELLERMRQASDGDARRALTLLETAAASCPRAVRSTPPCWRARCSARCCSTTSRAISTTT
jgi:replication-associated recombination protein RarA